MAHRSDEVEKLAQAFNELEAFGQKLTDTMFASPASAGVK
jgi:hypothetical protein